MKVLIAGCGYVGIELGRRLVASGHVVWGLRRSADRLPVEIRPVGADLLDAGSLDVIPGGLDAVVYAASADASEPAAYRAAYVEGPRNLATALPGDVRTVFVSSTAVYGERRGAGVDDDTDPTPANFRGEILLEAEEEIRALCEETVVVRPSGIYGPGRDRLIRMAAEGRQIDDRWTNRIHRDDLASVLQNALERPAPAATYLASDQRPARLHEVLAWLAAELGAEPPGPVERDRGAAADGSLPGKRCIPRRLLDEGFEFRFPTWRDGYAATLHEER